MNMNSMNGSSDLQVSFKEQIFNGGIAKVMRINSLLVRDNELCANADNLRRPDILRGLELEILPYIEPDKVIILDKIKQEMGDAIAEVMHATKNSEEYSQALNKLSKTVFNFSYVLRLFLAKNGFDMPEKKSFMHTIGEQGI